MTADVSAWQQAGLLYEIDDEVAWLRLNRPQKRNAMDHYPTGNGPGGMGLRDALLAAIHEVSEDSGVKAAIITGTGTAFSSGADLTQEGGPIEIPPERRRGALTARDDGLLYGWYRLMEAIWRSEKPFIAAVNGPASGKSSCAGASLLREVGLGCSPDHSAWPAPRSSPFLGNPCRRRQPRSG